MLESEALVSLGGKNGLAGEGGEY